MSGVSNETHTQEQLDHYANQNNPNNDAYQANQDNHANQLNPNNSAYQGGSSKNNEMNDFFSIGGRPRRVFV